MSRQLQAQGLMYGSCWIVAVAQGQSFTHTVQMADGSTLADGKSYSSAEMAIAAAKQLVDRRNQPSDNESFRWID